MVTFDGVNKKIILPSTGTYDVGVNLYSDWKEWATTANNAKYLKAFDTTGGDPIGAGQSIAPYFFLRTDLGWVIKAPESDGDVILQGNLFPRDSGDALFEQPTGDFTVLIQMQVSSQSISAGGSGFTAQDAARLLDIQTRMDTKTNIKASIGI